MQPVTITTCVQFLRVYSHGSAELYRSWLSPDRAAQQLEEYLGAAY